MKMSNIILVGGILAAIVLLGRRLNRSDGVGPESDSGIDSGDGDTLTIVHDLNPTADPNFTPFADPVPLLTRGTATLGIGVSGAGHPVVQDSNTGYNYAVVATAPTNLSRTEKTKYCQDRGAPVLASSKRLYFPSGNECLAPL